MISIKSVDAHLRRLAQPVESVALPIRQAVGRCLRQPLLAKRAAPPFDRVMMDGYAVRAATLQPGQHRFHISGTAPAGRESPPLDDHTCAIEVMTGAVLPPGADCVVPLEVCRVQGQTLEISKDVALEPGGCIHRCGAEYPEGELILREGTLLHPAHLALAASEGYGKLTVNTDLQVHLITTGDEIIEAGASPLPWQIFGTHSVAIEAALAGSRDIQLHRRHVRDDLAELVAAVDAGRTGTNVIILCGAMSKGSKDFGISAMQHCGYEVAFHRVAQRPGHPMAVAHRRHTIIFGLPGNPLAVLFTFYRHVLPTLDRLRGCLPVEPLRVLVAGELPALAEATRFVPCRLDHGQALLSTPHNSGDLLCLAGSDGFIEIPPVENDGEPSQPVSFWPWI